MVCLGLNEIFELGPKVALYKIAVLPKQVAQDPLYGENQVGSKGGTGIYVDMGTGPRHIFGQSFENVLFLKVVPPSLRHYLTCPK